MHQNSTNGTETGKMEDGAMHLSTRPVTEV
jgi:hypothetical protein